MAKSPTTDSTSLSLEDETFILQGKEVIEILGLECEVCKEQYDMSKKQPKSLPCRHTVCLSCLKDIEKTAQEQSYDGDFEIECPICREELSRNLIDKLLNDHRVVRGLDAISKAKSNCKNKCLEHNYQSLESFCETCMSPVCEDCIALHHEEGKGHMIVDLTKAMKKNATRFDELEKKCTAHLREMSAKEDIIKNIKTHLEIQEKQAIDKINKEFDGYSNILTKRKEELVNLVNERIKKRKSEIATEAFQLAESRKQLRAMYDRFKDSRENANIRSMYKLWKKLVEEEDKTAISLSEEELCRTFEFTALNEERLKSDMESLGDVQTKVDLTMQWST